MLVPREEWHPHNMRQSTIQRTLFGVVALALSLAVALPHAFAVEEMRELNDGGGKKKASKAKSCPKGTRCQVVNGAPICITTSSGGGCRRNHASSSSLGSPARAFPSSSAIPVSPTGPFNQEPGDRSACGRTSAWTSPR